MKLTWQKYTSGRRRDGSAVIQPEAQVYGPEYRTYFETDQYNSGALHFPSHCCCQASVPIQPILGSRDQIELASRFLVADTDAGVDLDAEAAVAIAYQGVNRRVLVVDCRDAVVDAEVDSLAARAVERSNYFETGEGILDIAGTVVAGAADIVDAAVVLDIVDTAAVLDTADTAEVADNPDTVPAVLDQDIAVGHALRTQNHLPETSSTLA